MGCGPPVRTDMSLIAMAEHLDMLRAIAGRTTIPIVADFRSDLRMAAIGADRARARRSRHSRHVVSYRFGRATESRVKFG